MVGLNKDLEVYARRIRSRARNGSALEPQAQIEVEIAYLSERLDKLRATHKEQLRGILREECRLRVDHRSLLNHRPRIYAFSDSARNAMKKRLFELSKERRRLIAEQAKTEADLQDRLFKLLRQHAILGGVDDRN